MAQKRVTTELDCGLNCRLFGRLVLHVLQGAEGILHAPHGQVVGVPVIVYVVLVFIGPGHPQDDVFLLGF